MRFAPQNLTADTIGSFPGDIAQTIALGTLVRACSNDYQAVAGVVNGGGGDFRYVKAVATLIPGTLVVVDKDWNISACPTTGNTGRPVFVCISAFDAVNCFGWVMASGICPIKTAVAATVGPVFVSNTAGQVTPTAAAGKAVLSATCLTAASGTFTRVGRTLKGSKRIEVADISGLYVGLVPSGSGIAAGTIESVDPGGTGFNNSAVATASATVTVTFTHTGYGIFHINNPHVQGQIT